MRIVSLLPSATEILFALGLEEQIVGVSHECDHPARARQKPSVVRSRIPAGLSPAEMDQKVREFVSRGESLYAVDAEALERLKPDLIVTQDLCHVCAATPEELGAALARFANRPEVLAVTPEDLGDVWRDILWIGEATGRRERAEELVHLAGVRLAGIRNAAQADEHRPRTVLLEWLDPFYVGGHWVPEMIEQAGGVDVLGGARKPSFRVTIEDLVEASPEVIFVAPCGYNKEQAREEYLRTTFPSEWMDLPAVQNGRVYALDANSYVSRPGLRLVTGIEAMAKALHPQMQVRAGAEAAMVQLPMPGKSAQVAKA